MGWLGDAGDLVNSWFGGGSSSGGSTVSGSNNNPDPTKTSTDPYAPENQVKPTPQTNTIWVSPGRAVQAPGPYTTGPGLQSGQSQPQFQGLDFTQRGPAEQQWIDSRDAYNTPGFGQQNTQNIVTELSNRENRPQLSNNQQAWFDQFKGQVPNLMNDPGLSAYFDNAKARAAESINKSAAATGAYGASSANDQTARAFSDLEAQRAFKEADYALQRAAEDRAWQGLGGELAGGADSQSGAVSEDERRWADLLSGMGGQVDDAELRRLNAAMDASGLAQGAERTRGQDYFNNTAAAGDRFSDQQLRIMLQALGVDPELFLAESSGNVAQGNAALQNETSNAQTTSDAAQAALAFTQ